MGGGAGVDDVAPDVNTIPSRSIVVSEGARVLMNILLKLKSIAVRGMDMYMNSVSILFTSCEVPNDPKLGTMLAAKSIARPTFSYPIFKASKLLRHCVT